jgi:oxalate decarboxylase/phosphoglucose isomerase-like protein (cupin superfamily)
LASESAQNAAPWTGAILHAADGQRIPLAGGRELTIKVDSRLTPSVRMSMVIEDLPPGAEILVHWHEREDEIIFIRMGRGIATLGNPRGGGRPWGVVQMRSGERSAARDSGVDPY